MMVHFADDVDGIALLLGGDSFQLIISWHCARSCLKVGRRFMFGLSECGQGGTYWDVSCKCCGNSTSTCSMCVCFLLWSIERVFQMLFLMHIRYAYNVTTDAAPRRTSC